MLHVGSAWTFSATYKLRYSSVKSCTITHAHAVTHTTLPIRLKSEMDRWSTDQLSYCLVRQYSFSGQRLFGNDRSYSNVTEKKSKKSC